MSIELILGGIGTALGIANLVYWAWLARREKVVVVRSEVYPEFLRQGTLVEGRSRERIPLSHALLSIEVECSLVLISGRREEVREVEVTFNEAACNRLSKYFDFPFRNRLHLHPVDTDEGEESTMAMLKPKESADFKRRVYLDCTDEFERQYEKMESGSYPEFIQPLLDKLETKYQICWTRSDNRRLCWRFPDEWYRNLGKRLWG